VIARTEKASLLLHAAVADHVYIDLDIANIRFFIAPSEMPRFSQHGSQAALFALRINGHVACRDIELSCAGMRKARLVAHDRPDFDQGKRS